MSNVTEVGASIFLIVERLDRSEIIARMVATFMAEAFPLLSIDAMSEPV